MHSRKTILTLGAAGMAVWTALVAPAQAQLMLPGAVPSAPVGAPDTPTTGGPAKPAAPPPVKTPGEESITRKELRRNGSTGLVSFELQGKDLQITRLTLPGRQISRPADICRVDVSGGPFTLKPVGKHEGLSRYEASIEACPIVIDVLEGAVQVQAPGGVCTFKEADCNASPTGIWGPPPSSFKADEAKNIEKARAAADNTARTYFRALLNVTTDKQKVRAIAAEQAAFSSRREEMCRDYAREDVFGYCAARITEARAVALRAQLYPNAKEEAPPRKKPAAPRKPAAPKDPTPTGAIAPPPGLR